jgi:hypothetical protein
LPVTATATTPITAGSISTQLLTHRSDGMAAATAQEKTTIHARGGCEAVAASPMAPLANNRPTPTPESSAAATAHHCRGDRHPPNGGTLDKLMRAKHTGVSFGASPARRGDERGRVKA